MNYKYLYVNGDSFSKGQDLEVKKDVKRFEVDSKYRFSSIIAEKYNLFETNQSKSGGSNQRIVRTFLDWSENNTEKLNETLVIIGWTVPYRYEILTDDGWLAKNAGVGWISPFKMEIDDVKLEHLNVMYWLDLRNKIISTQNFLKLKKVDYLFFMVHEDKVSFDLESIQNDKLIDDTKFMNITFDKFSESVIGEKVWGFRHPNRESNRLWAEKLVNEVKRIYK